MPPGHPRPVVAVVLLVAAAVLTPVVLMAGFAWPIYDSLFCRSSCGHDWAGTVTIWVLGGALVGGLFFLGVRGIVRTPEPPRPDV